MNPCTESRVNEDLFRESSAMLGNFRPRGYQPRYAPVGSSAMSLQALDPPQGIVGWGYTAAVKNRSKRMQGPMQ